MPADHGRRPQHGQRIWRDALHPAVQDDPHGVGDLHRVEIELARPVVARIEQTAFVLQVPEKLGDEERIPAGVIGECLHDPRRRVGRAECGEQALHVGLGEWLQCYQTGVTLSDELIERRLDRV